MSDADTAYRIAEQRIERARARAEGFTYLCLAPTSTKLAGVEWEDEAALNHLATIPPAISALTEITRLDLDGTQVADLTPFAGMAGMQTLNISGTQVEDITHLAGMTAMQSLNLNSTKVEDISHLAGMTAMQTLYLDATKVEDISHLADMTEMQSLDLTGTKADLLQLVVEGASWAKEDRTLQDLKFQKTPATQSDECLVGVYDANDSDADRTKAALAALRAERDRWKAAKSEPPEPREGAIAFGSDEDGKVILTETSPPVDDPAQEALQHDLLRAARELATQLDGDNQFGALAQDAAGYAALLSRPAAEIAAKALWPLDVRLRNALTADQAADEAGRLNDMLPPLARSALEGVVAIGAPWLQDHPGYQTLVEVLKRHIADDTEEAEAEVSAEIVDALEHPQVAENIDEATLAIGQAARKAAFDPGPIGRQNMAKKSLLDYARGFTVHLMNAPLKALKWSDGAIVWVSTRAAGVLVVRQILLALEPVLKTYVAQYLPNYVFYFQKLMDAIRTLPF